MKLELVDAKFAQKNANSHASIKCVFLSTYQNASEVPTMSHASPLSNSNIKFRALVYFFIQECKDPDMLGAIRLNKALWYTDVFSCLAHGKQMTEADYVKRQFGPVPKEIMLVLRELRTQEAITITEPEARFEVRRFAINRQIKNLENVLDEDEKTLARLVLDAVLGYGASEISELTHDDIWRNTPEGEKMHPSVAAERLLPPALYSPEELSMLDERAREGFARLTAMHAR